MNIFLKTTASVITTAALSTFTLASAEEQGIQISMVVEKEITTIDAFGKPHLKREKPSLVVPGEEVIYTTHYLNNLSEKADNINIVAPIPEHTTYINGSASDNSGNVHFSVDQGQHYALASELTIENNGIYRPATAKDYTHIRWQLESLMPKTQGSVDFRVKVN